MATAKWKLLFNSHVVIGVLLVFFCQSVLCDKIEVERDLDVIDKTIGEQTGHSNDLSCETNEEEVCNEGNENSIESSIHSSLHQTFEPEASESDNTDQKTVEVKDEAKEELHVGNVVRVNEGESGFTSEVQHLLEQEKAELEGTESKGDEPLVGNDSDTEVNSTIIQWIKYFFDPFLEEFRDGIYSNISEKSNKTEANISDVHLVETNNNTDSNMTDLASANVTETDSQNVTDSGKKVKFQCVGRNVTEETNATVSVITSAKFLQLLTFEHNSTENSSDCLVVMFYAPWCQFCAKTAPHYNALARAFPQLDFVAVDTAQFSNILARFGTVYVPNILVFHQSRAAVKFNQTEREFNTFVSFIRNTTGMEPNVTVNVTNQDYLGPVPSTPTDDPDYLLLISWIFVIFCSTCMFVKSQKGQQWITRVRVLWQEHQHID